MKLTGSQVERLLEQQWQSNRMLQISGISYSWHSTAPVGDHVAPADIQIGGNPLDVNATYTVTVNNFLADGGDGFTVLKEGTGRVVGPTDLGAPVDYVKQLPQPFNSTLQDRILQMQPVLP